MSDLEGKKFTKRTGECPSCKTPVNNIGKCPGCGANFRKDGTFTFMGKRGAPGPLAKGDKTDDTKDKEKASGAKAVVTGPKKDEFFSW